MLWYTFLKIADQCRFLIFLIVVIPIFLWFVVCFSCVVLISSFGVFQRLFAIVQGFWRNLLFLWFSFAVIQGAVANLTTFHSHFNYSLKNFPDSILRAVAKTAMKIARNVSNILEISDSIFQIFHSNDSNLSWNLFKVFGGFVWLFFPPLFQCGSQVREYMILPIFSAVFFLETQCIFFSVETGDVDDAKTVDTKETTKTTNKNKSEHKNWFKKRQKSIPILMKHLNLEWAIFILFIWLDECCTKTNENK